jgi:hypothetical protein
VNVRRTLTHHGARGAACMTFASRKKLNGCKKIGRRLKGKIG